MTLILDDNNELDWLRIRDDTFLTQIIHKEELTSTNAEAAAFSAQNELDGPLLIIAERQSAGRGRGSNRWWSAEGALTFTLLMDLPSLPAQQVGSLSLTVGVSICQALEKLAPNADIGLKWPNDVFWNGKKLAGILIERLAVPGIRLAIGIGINVNNSLRTAPLELQRTATSLFDAFDAPVSRTSVLIECLQHMECRVDDHIRRHHVLVDLWRAYSFLTGRAVTVHAHGEKIEGICTGIDDDGALLVRDGETSHRCVAGVVHDFQ